MKTSHLISVLCWISSLLLLQGCSINRADNLRMLDQRAEYDSPTSQEPVPALHEGGIDGFKESPVPVRTRGQVATCWFYPRKLGLKDYFWGAWVSVVTADPDWILEKPGATPKAPAVVKMRTKPRIPKAIQLSN
jgi:hypothetical protein